MRYEQIVRGIKEHPWLITPGGFDTILEIVERRNKGERLDYEDIQVRLGGAGRGGNNRAEAGGGVGVLPLYGPIFPKANLMTEMSGATSLEQFQSDFRSLLSNDMVGTIVLDIDSPGGVAFGVPEVAEEIFNGRSIKPVVAVASPMAASAALYLGSQADEFFVTPSGQVGSIGVLAVHENTTAMNEKMGIKTTFITAGKYKAELASEKELSEEAIAYQQEIVDDIYVRFLEDVARGRDTSTQDVMDNYGEGRMLTAKKALDVGLVDGIETLDGVLDSLLNTGGKLASSTTARARSLTPRASYDREKEHSEPGTGLGGGEPQEDPQYHPNEREDDWSNGARFDPPYLPPEESLMHRDTLLEYAQRLKVEHAPKLSDEELATAVSEKLDVALDQVEEINEAVAAAERTRSFATDYPEEYDELQKIKAERRESAAKMFADGFSRLKDADGKETKHGLSIPVREEIEQAHTLLSEGAFGEEHLEAIINMVASKGATVEFGERGSSRMADIDSGIMPTGNRTTDRKAFADVVRNIMEEDTLDRKAAIKVAGERYPELAQAYAQ